MSVYKPGESEEYDKSAQAARQLLDRLAREPELKTVKALFWRLLHSLPSAPIKVLASFADDRFYPLVLSLEPREFSSYLALSHGEVVAARSRERIAALSSVYEVARSRIDLLDTEFRPFIDQLDSRNQVDIDNLSLPPDRIMRQFCAPALYYFEVKDILLGLPDTTGELDPGDLLNLNSPQFDSRKLRELASDIKSRALNRFYLSFLSSFAIQMDDHLESDADVWSTLNSGEVFSCAISDALYAVEYPERLSEKMPHLSELIARFKPESLWDAIKRG